MGFVEEMAAAFCPDHTCPLLGGFLLLRCGVPSRGGSPPLRVHQPAHRFPGHARCYPPDQVRHASPQTTFARYLPCVAVFCATAQPGAHRKDVAADRQSAAGSARRGLSDSARVDHVQPATHDHILVQRCYRRYCSRSNLHSWLLDVVALSHSAYPVSSVGLTISLPYRSSPVKLMSQVWVLVL